MEGNRRKNQKLNLWVSPEIRRKLDETAKEMGLTPSEIARHAITFYLLYVAKKEAETQ